MGDYCLNGAQLCTNEGKPFHLHITDPDGLSVFKPNTTSDTFSFPVTESSLGVLS